MGEVWEAAHPDRQIPVAVKLLKRGGPAKHRSVSAFWNEVRALAVLDHPHVLQLLDIGELAEELEAPDGGRVAAGCPYLVLELARGGDLQSWVARPRPWEEVRGVLLALLDALGHAHARGVLHLDIKPANVLWGAPQDERPGLKLGDFGIAHLWSSGDQTGGSSGTPAYMAPEQLSPRAGRLGPWSDLYAVGLLAWALIHGVLPAAQPPASRSRGHRDALRQPQISVPEDVYPWLERLLRADPEGRYRRAADAAWALKTTGEAPMVSAGAPIERPLERADTVALTRGTTWSTRVATAQDRAAPQPPPRLPAAAPGWLNLGSDLDRGDLPPIPSRGLTGPRPRAHPLRGIGAALHGLTLPPLVGREEEQEALWAALVETASSGRARVVAARGPAGFGKSRLLRWLSERAHEVGAAEVIAAVHSPERGPHDGLWSMAARALRVGASRTPEALTELAATLKGAVGLAEPDLDTAARLLMAGAEGAESVEGATRPAERFRLLYGVLAGLCQGRVGLIAIDDVQWGREALEFVQFALTCQESNPAPLLFALSVQEEALALRPAEAELLDALTRRAEVRAIPVGPLRVSDWPAMVDAFVTLEPALAAAIIEGTQGNPLFAAQLLDDWLARGLLVATPAGYAAVGEVPLQVPEDLARFWAARVTGALSDRPPRERAAVELAAFLGAEVDPDEWSAVCAAAQIQAGPELVALLLERGLARAGAGGIGQGWAFAHGLLRQALVSEAEAGGRGRDHHRRCAEGLSRLGAGQWLRVARHFLAAGLPERALGPLSDGLSGGINHLPIGEARAVLGLLEQALDEAAVPEGDLRRWNFRLLRHTVGRRDSFARGSLEPELAELEAQARAQGWTTQVVAVLRDRAVLLHDLGRFQDAEAVAVEALALARGAGGEPTLALGNILGSLAMIWIQLQRLTDAERAYTEASEIYERLGAHFLAGAARAGLAEACLHQDRLQDAERMAALARGHAERSGSAHARAEADALWGEVRRVQGDLQQAEALLRSAILGFRALASARECLPTVNLALVLLAQRRVAEAAATSERVLVLARAPGAGWLEVHAQIHLLVPRALSADWEAVNTHLSRAEVLCDRDPPADIDLAGIATEAVSLLDAAGQPELAARAARLAARIWRAVRREDEALRVEQRPTRSA